MTKMENITNKATYAEIKKAVSEWIVSNALNGYN